MGVYGENACKPNAAMYSVIYFVAILALLVVGSLYETEVIPRNNDYTSKSVWWYGAIGIVLTAGLVLVLNWLFAYLSTKANYVRKYESYVWYTSHILCYFTLTLVSPGQWPFWLAAGILWEWFECYSKTACGITKGTTVFGTKLRIPINCSGFYDITANMAGIAIAMWLRSEIPIDTLLK